jgi:hypothetical protein
MHVLLNEDGEESYDHRDMEYECVLWDMGSHGVVSRDKIKL